MSERYRCRHCGGTGRSLMKNEKGENRMCYQCVGVGTTGDAMDYLQEQYDSDWEKDRPNMYYATPKGLD